MIAYLDAKERRGTSYNPPVKRKVKIE